jgi:hypothetical protein
MKLRIYWFPNVPCKAFHVEVFSVEEAILINNTLAEYDLFLYNNKHRPDYCNTGGLQVWNENDQEWEDWYNEEGESFDEYIQRLETEKERNEATNE